MFLWSNKVKYIFAWSSELLIWSKLKISDNYFSFIRDGSFSSTFFLVVFGFSSTTQQHLKILNASDIYLYYKKSYEKVTFCRTWGFIVKLIWGKTKPCIKNWQW